MIRTFNKSAHTHVFLILFYIITYLLIPVAEHDFVTKLTSFQGITIFICGLISFYSAFSLITPMAFKYKSSLLFIMVFFWLLFPLSLFESLIIEFGRVVDNKSIDGEIPRQFEKISLHIGKGIGHNFFYGICGTAFSMFQITRTEEQKKSKLESENIKSEISMLQAQINPHFLFNSLNNIYTLVYKKSDQAPEAITKLTELLEYMQIDNSREHTSIGQELKHINNYIDLQRLRYTADKQIIVNCADGLEQIQIPPLLLIPFIENAFKHGTQTGDIIIEMKKTEKDFLFTVKNEIPEKMVSKDKTKGIGIQNVERRLDLLYPKKYRLKKQIENTYFVVELKLELS